MSKTTRIELRISAEEKAEAEALAASRGQSLSDLIRAALARMIRRARMKGVDE